MSLDFNPNYSPEEVARELILHLSQELVHTPRKFLNRYVYLEDASRVCVMKLLVSEGLAPKYLSRKKLPLSGYDLYTVCLGHIKANVPNKILQTIKGKYLEAKA